MDSRKLILYEDRWIIVLRKPAGIAVESARVTQQDLVSALKAEHGDVLPVHRLDQVVEGAVVFARTRQAAEALSRQLAGGDMAKEYLARVCGPIRQEEATLTDYLVRDGRAHMARVVPPPKGALSGKNGPKKAVLRYRRAGADLVSVELITGRFHQIRAQLAHAGMPIAGDGKYGAPPESAEGLMRGQIALTAVYLSFAHPETGEEMAFSVSPSWLKEQTACGKNGPET